MNHMMVPNKGGRHRHGHGYIYQTKQMIELAQNGILLPQCNAFTQRYGKCCKLMVSSKVGDLRVMFLCFNSKVICLLLKRFRRSLLDTIVCLNKKEGTCPSAGELKITFCQCQSEKSQTPTSDLSGDEAGFSPFGFSSHLGAPYVLFSILFIFTLSISFLACSFATQLARICEPS